MSNSFYLASSLVVAYLSDWDVSLWPATFPALRLIYDWHMPTLWVNCLLRVRFHPSRFGIWVVIHVIAWITGVETIKTADLRLNGCSPKSEMRHYELSPYSVQLKPTVTVIKGWGIQRQRHATLSCIVPQVAYRSCSGAVHVVSQTSGIQPIGRRLSLRRRLDIRPTTNLTPPCSAV